MRLTLIFEVLMMVLWSGVSAQARYYRCRFANPDFNLYISTKHQRVTKDSTEGGAFWKIVQSKKVVSGHEMREVFHLENGPEVQVSLSASGRDGDSEFFYPYRASFQGFDGGCESEDVDNESYLARTRSLVNIFGEVLISPWAVEYGDYQDFKVNKDFTLPARSTWLQLSAFSRDNKQCTLKKGSRFIPATKSPGESYVRLSLPEKFVAKMKSRVEEDGFTYKKGDEVIQLAYEAEGYCIVEKNGSRHSILCILPEGKEFKKMESTAKHFSPRISETVSPPDGDYIYTQCAEGHFTWVPTALLEFDSSSFRRVTQKPN